MVFKKIKFKKPSSFIVLIFDDFLERCRHSFHVEGFLKIKIK
jgi:hypothetical protein